MDLDIYLEKSFTLFPKTVGVLNLATGTLYLIDYQEYRFHMFYHPVMGYSHLLVGCDYLAVLYWHQMYNF